MGDVQLVETPLQQVKQYICIGLNFTINGLFNLQTIPFDPRFPNQNQTKNCWQNYVDFHRCQKLKGEE